MTTTKYKHPEGIDVLSLIKLFADPLDVVVVVTDANLNAPGPTVLYTNPAYESMTGYTPDEAIGNSPRMLQGKRTNRLELKKLSQDLRKGCNAQTTVINYRKNGDPYYCDITAWPIIDTRGEVTHFIAFEREVIRKRGRPAKKDPAQKWWLDALKSVAV